MRTKIQCSWLVGYVGNGHVLWRDAELVYEGTQIVFVGERFEGTADQVIDAGGKLVIPGFIDTHVHSGHRASHRLISDVGRPDYFGQPFFEISVPRAGTRVGGDPRYARSDDALTADELLLNARFTVAELLRNGITTFVEFGSQLKVQGSTRRAGQRVRDPRLSRPRLRQRPLGRWSRRKADPRR